MSRTAASASDSASPGAESWQSLFRMDPLSWVRLSLPTARRMILLGALAGTVPLSPLHAQSAGPDAVSETYGEWTVRCVTDPAPTDQAVLTCEMRQELFQGESGQRLLAFSLRRAAGDSDISTLTIVAPFGLLLSKGMQIVVADETLVDIAFRTCLRAGCIGVAEIDAATIAALAEAEDITVAMTAAATEAPVTVPLLTQGFAAAWARLAR